jgi:hypothetical protein
MRKVARTSPNPFGPLIDRFADVQSWLPTQSMAQLIPDIQLRALGVFQE